MGRMALLLLLCLMSLGLAGLSYRESWARPGLNSLCCGSGLGKRQSVSVKRTWLITFGWDGDERLHFRCDSADLIGAFIKTGFIIRLTQWVSTAASRRQGPRVRFPGLGVTLSVQSLHILPHRVCVGFLRVLRFPPTVRKLCGLGWIGRTKFYPQCNPNRRQNVATRGFSQ